MMFLLNRWDSLMNYNPATSFDEAVNIEKRLDEFFSKTESLINMKKSAVKDTSQKWSKAELTLNKFMNKTQHEVREALSDNFDTPRAINDLLMLVKETNKYMD